MTDYQQRESSAVDALKKAIPSSLKPDMLADSKGLFAELYENDDVFPDHYLACGIDGVGTKLILAEAMGIYDTIGIDCVAMSANDLATLGPVSPFLFMDYLACQSKVQEERLTKDIIAGIVKGLGQADASKALRNSIRVNLGKGETASVDELLSSTRPGYGFDIAGCMIGFLEKQRLKTTPKDGDVILSLPSSGPHSNGYTALRHHLLKGDFEPRKEFKKHYRGKHTLDEDFEGTTLGKALLEPTRIYTADVAKAARDHDLIGINNTGYGLKNLNRLPGSFRFIIDTPPSPQPIFDLFQRESGYTDEQMYTTFNMGMGFFMVTDKKDADDILQVCKDAQVVGFVEKAQGKATVLRKDGEEFSFTGY